MRAPNAAALRAEVKPPGEPFAPRGPGECRRQRKRPLEPELAVADIQRDVRKESMIQKLRSGEYRLYSRKKDPKTGKRRNLGTFKTRQAAEQHEREVQFFKRH